MRGAAEVAERRELGAIPRREEPAVHLHAVRDVGLDAVVLRVCRQVPPLWPLEDLVAVNPFLGYAHLPFLSAHDHIRARLHADVLPPAGLLRRMRDEGAFDRRDVRDALTELRGAHPELSTLGLSEAGPIYAALEDGLLDAEDGGPRVLSLAERLDSTEGTAIAPAIVADIARFCAARFDRGAARWPSPFRGGGFYEDWRSFALHDGSMDARGIRGFRQLVRSLPGEPASALCDLVAELDLGTAALEDYFGRLLSEVLGWAGVLRQQSWDRGQAEVGELPELLTVRLAYDVGLARLRPDVLARVPAVARELEDPRARAAVRRHRLTRYVLLRAAEGGFVRRLLADLNAPAAAGPSRATSVQAVFCIDVRSERLRRQLEQVAPEVQTYGFAGFFGLPVEMRGAEGADLRRQCPPLLKPTHGVAVQAHRGRWTGLTAQVHALLCGFRRSPVSCFSYVETLGLGHAWPMLADSFGARSRKRSKGSALLLDGISATDRVALVAGLLDKVGLREPHGRLLLLCGHGSSVENNPQAASLACGACGGHSGELNARIATRLVNDPQVRRGLHARGMGLPDDCVAVAGVHDTTIDRISLVDLEAVPASHRADVEALQHQLHLASAATRAERAGGLPGCSPRSGSDPLPALLRRARDWAELRPEWALAGNAAFIAARRERTRGVDLDGRCFLHDYDEKRDADGSVLEMILTAPVVVATWINLQYYASTVAPQRYGSGTKTIHNVVGGVGVVSGTEGDLATGLSLEAVHDGEGFRHEPLRLQVFVEASRGRIDRVLASHPGLRDLVHNGWLALYALASDDAGCWRHDSSTGWVREQRAPLEERRSGVSVSVC